MYATASAPAQDRLDSFPTYVEAQHAVDTLSDRGFPVERLRIVGHGITTVENVTGRWTKGRAAIAGAGTGAWIGLLIGLIVGIFLPTAVWLSILLASAALGALWGALLGFATQWSTRGSRDFRSTKSLVAERYDVMVDGDWAPEARRALDQPLPDLGPRRGDQLPGMSDPAPRSRTQLGP